LPAVPKSKRSKAKRNTKRNSFKLNIFSIVECPRCRAKKIAHRVCQSCGYYDNKEIIPMEKKKKEKSAEKTGETSKTKTGTGNASKKRPGARLRQNQDGIKSSSNETARTADKPGGASADDTAG